MNELYVEIDAQFKSAIKLFGSISHIDTHQNTHIIPGIIDVLIVMCFKYEVSKIRGQSCIYNMFGNKNNFKGLIKNHYSKYWESKIPSEIYYTQKILLNAPGLGRRVHDLNHALRLWGSALNNLRLSNEIIEVPCHLGLSDLEFALYRSNSFFDLLNSNNIKIGNYNDF